MSFFAELQRCLALGFTLQFQDAGIETPVYHKRTHGSRTDMMQGIDVLRSYAFKFEDARK